ncbi:MAG: ATP-binding protein [bacterium]
MLNIFLILSYVIVSLFAGNDLAPDDRIKPCGYLPCADDTSVDLQEPDVESKNMNMPDSALKIFNMAAISENGNITDYHQDILFNAAQQWLSLNHRETALPLKRRQEALTPGIINIQFSGINGQINFSQYFISAVLAFVLIALVFIFGWLSRRKSHALILEKKNKELEETNKRLKKSEESLKKSNQTKAKFFSIIAHDLRNPFNVMLGFSEILANEKYQLNEEQVKKYSSIINQTARNVYKLIENLLEWSRTQTDKIKYNPEYFDLNSVVVIIFTLFETAAYNKGIDLVSKVKKNTMVYGDKNLISTVLRNLTDNALKFTGKGGTITLETEQAENWITVFVKDTGKGMTPEQRDKVFDLEASFSSNGTEDEPGTGLGLILCKEFISMNKGHIDLTSSQEKGTTFYFTIPLREDVVDKSPLNG